MPFPSGDSSVHAVITLRMINTVISEHRSPSSIPFMISQLYMTPVLEICAFLSTSQKYIGDRSEGSALLHRFKTGVASLLQSKSPKDKWSEAQATPGNQLGNCYTDTSIHRPNYSQANLDPPDSFAKFPDHHWTCPEHTQASDSSALDAMPSEGTLATALESLKDLLCHNQATFRPFTQRTQKIALSVLSPQCGLTKLRSLEGCKAAGHPAGMVRQNSSTEVSGASTIGLGEWKGISKGFDKAEMLLRLLWRFPCHPTSSQVVIPLGQLVWLTGRLTGLSCKAAESNPAIERPERETVATIYSEHGSDTGIRTAVYTHLTTLRNLFGPALDKQTVASVHPILSSLYTDLVLNADGPKNPPPAKLTGKRSSKNTGKQKEARTDSFFSRSSWLNSRQMWLRGLVSAGEGLLAAVLGKLPPNHIRSQMRRLLDRATMCTMSEKAMIESALFPSTTPNGNSRAGSILPHLVGASRGNLAIEGTVSPRLPVLWVGRVNDVEEGEEEEADGDDEEIEGEEEKYVAKPGTTRTIVPITALARHTETIPENARLEATDSDDERIIPDIDMWESSGDEDEADEIQRRGGKVGVGYWLWHPT
ncbi:hypothetical protein C7212DRAFT_343566 [Tuber magnatum]|uniref:Pre-rRNA-processing protein RIX1 n=1 Tax=Tuber magnatum TaxID=42249 RepID=A0A317SSJ8_9PEZI|nr:hypothetical protein C7212DRAFT_343566 [Tuber magnatum]